MSRYFGTDGFRGEANINLNSRPRLSSRPFPRLVLYRKTGPRRGGGPAHQRGPRPHRHRQGHPPQLVYVRVLPGSRPGGFRRGRLHAPRHHHALRGLHRPGGRLRLRHHDFRQPQPLLRQRHQAHQRPGREDGRGDHRAGGGLPGRQAGGLSASSGPSCPSPRRTKSAAPWTTSPAGTGTSAT